MYFGVNAWVWTSPVTTSELAWLVPKVAEIGFDWIEVPLETIGDLDYGEANIIISDHGLKVSVCAAMGPDRDLIHYDESIRRNGMDYIRHCIDAASMMGATNLIGPIYSAVGRVWQQTAEERTRDLDILEHNLRDLGDYAEKQGVVIALEPLNRFETSFINTVTQALEVLERVDSAGCKLMLDTFHMNIEEKSLGDAIRAGGPHLVHVHACENDRGAPGSGHVPWDDVAQALRDIRYDGPVVIESFTSKVKSIARAAAVWRAFEPSQDGLAINGLAFLKRLLAGG